MSAPSGSRSSLLARLCLAASLVLAAAPAAAENGCCDRVGAPSLWSDRGASLVTDLRARRAGDIVTILIDEQSTAEKQAQTDLKRDSQFSSQLNPPAFQNPKFLRDLLVNLNASGTGKSDYNGDGKTNRTDRATGVLTARVARVLENGNLVVEGRRVVKVNDETQTIVVSGIVRPWDITPDNTVPSSRVADAEVRLEGQGTVSDRQKPGLLQRIFDFIGLY
jgi:flagellar L-ring protein precursor FlgH